MAAALARSVRACLITNPRSGHGVPGLSEIVALLRSHGWDVTVQQKQHGGQATDLARAAADAGYDVVVGCGGDGTLSEIVDGLAGTDVAVGVIPGGTVNLWARELGISNRPRVAAMQLLTAERRRIDLGHVEVNGRHARHFLLMAGIGVDGAVMERVSKPLKRRIGRLAVAVATLQALRSVQQTAACVDVDGVRWRGVVTQIVAGNTRRYGGFGCVTPSARVDDARLDLCLFTTVDPVAACRQAAALLLRGRPSGSSAETYRGARIRIQAPVILPLQVDGGYVSLDGVRPEAGGVTYDLTSRPGAITMLVPDTYDGALFQGGSGVDQHRPSGTHRHRDRANGGADNRSADLDPVNGSGESKRRLRVTSVGVDALGGVRTKNGRPVNVQITAHTVARDADGNRVAGPELLSLVREGDLVRVKGVKGSEPGLFIACRLKLYQRSDD